MNQIFWDNEIYQWAIAIGIIAITFIAVKICKLVILKRIKIWTKKTKTTWDDFVVSLIERAIIPLLYISSIYFAVSTLKLPQKLVTTLHVAYLVCVTFFVLRIISNAFKKFIYSFIEREEDAEQKEKQAGGLIAICNFVIWILGCIFLVDNLGYNVTTLIAGLGVGGIAIALAAQAVLADLFSYFVIFFDKPFQIGDFVVVDDKSGNIEYIGIKTTRIKTLNGEQLICANKDLTDSRIHNYKRMEKRRIVFPLRVVYQTDHKVLAEIPELVKDIIENQRDVTFDRGHFSGYGDYSLNFEFVFYVLSSDYGVYMDKQQAIFLEIHAAFKEREITFAIPTRNVFMQNQENQKNEVEMSLNN
ncbi:mechanosensitive ion channel family protein [Pedobacter sp. UYP30]|uniref:mechanosensitive ion channel family protein n=1 Tax=Pedobacter sp. UYP30 TaxID=1756400 RepID=UPI003399D58A